MSVKGNWTTDQIDAYPKYEASVSARHPLVRLLPTLSRLGVNN
jgi:hypothetical protein